jgi:adenosine kinase
MTIICAGSIAFDYLMTFPGYFRDHILPEKLESISLSFLVDSMTRQRGGTAPNIAYNLALLGEHPAIFGAAGQDFQDYRIWLENVGVNTHYVRIIPGEYTASFFANTDLSNAQIASFYTGAMKYAAEMSLDDLAGETIDLMVISPDDPGAMRRHVMECRERKVLYLYDVGQQVARISVEDMRCGVEGAWALFVNEYEFELLQKHMQETAKEILKKVPLVVVTLGEEGANIYDRGELTHTEIVPPQRILDPTGVGDAFRAGFLRGYRLGFDWKTCGQMGALAATYCLEQRGTQSHSYDVESFVARYRQYFDDKGHLDVLLKASA